MINCASDYIEKIKLNPNYAVVYSEYVGTKSRYYSDSSLKNLTDNKHKGKLSDKSIKRLQNALDWLLLITKNKNADNLKNKGQFNFKVSMLTLTLPCDQLHDDNYVKKYMLNEFFTVIRKKYLLQNYIWRAEKTLKGNIHFHIIIDKYIFYKEVNTIWNNILKTHGYIEKYKENQELKHINGFYYDKKNSEKWSKSAQLKAYKNGVHTKWRNPSGTTDIHSLKKIKNAKNYLSKYITKSPELISETSKYCEMYKRVNNCLQVPIKIIDEIKKEVMKKLAVVGNLWYISRSLSKLKGIVLDITNEVGSELNSFRAKSIELVNYTDFCAIYKFSIKDIFRLGFENLGNKVKEYIFNLRQLFYAADEDVSSNLGLPLFVFE
jgi:hypothetical protein